MSIGIGITLPDGVLLVSDGRRIHPLAENKEIENDIDKIEKVKASVFAISFGVGQATEPALKKLRNEASPLKPPEDWLEYLESSVTYGWRSFLNRLSPEVDINHTALRAALVVGGISNHQPFIAGYLCSPEMKMDRPVMKKSPATHKMVVGGEKYQAETKFANKSRSIIDTISWQSGVGPENKLIKALIGAAEEVIREVESKGSRIGGVIRYIVIRQNFLNSRGKRTS